MVADRRTRRTRKSLIDALIGLMLEKRYDSITVQDIIDRADAGRSTFYAHCGNKDDLFLSGFQEMLEHLSRSLELNDPNGRELVPSLALFQHVQEHHRLYKALTRGGGIELLHKNGQRFLSEIIERNTPPGLATLKPHGIPLDVLSNFLAGSLLTLVTWWLDHDMPCSAERLDEMYRQLVMPGAHAALEMEREQP